MEKPEKPDRKYYSMSTDEIMDRFGTSEYGLNDEQAAANREKFGTNKLAEKKQKSVLQIFLSQFKDLLVIILIIAAAISMATGSTDSTIVIIAVLIMNAIIGTVQYVKARKSLESLKKLSSPEAKVIREGVQKIIPADDLVCGDIIVLDAGDIIPGDARVFESHTLKTNESALTGESLSSEKNEDVIDEEKVPLGDQKNMVFSGTLVTYGRAHAVVTAVGKDTELGRIASLMENAEERKTPLQITMDNFSKKLSIAIMIICAVVFALSLYRHMAILNALLFAVALAVAAIPEALSSIITISLAIGTKRMANQNAIVKDLSSVEGLGCVSIICSDKTGTLTQNKMQVGDISIYADRQLLDIAMAVNSTAELDGDKTIGNPTEAALLLWLKDQGEDYNALRQKGTMIWQLPFSTEHKHMATIIDIDERRYVMVKGAPEIVTAHCSLDNQQTQKIQQQLLNYQ
ncbi:MAG: cation-translocating P-type ATPase, partial [Anaerovoracaceae bacterium]